MIILRKCERHRARAAPTPAGARTLRRSLRQNRAHASMFSAGTSPAAARCCSRSDRSQFS